MEKNYDPKSFEDKIYKFWTDGNYFKAKIDPDKKPFTIVMPPPNITGKLHMGHALDNTLQDIVIRYKRMSGFSALWLPGTDHASIATELKIVEAMREEGLTKEQIGREKFLERAFEWKRVYGGRITEQLKHLGSSCDWSREAFTMDERCNKAVREVFVNLYNKGLIYQGSRIINWCPSCKTALSDAEVEYEEKASNLWHIKYPFSDNSGYLIIATTRPETMLGDTAVAVNPADPKYKNIVGKMLKLPLTDREIPVIADSYVEIGFGSGAVKITPAHDPNDFEVGLRHNLAVIRIMNDDSTMNEEAGIYKGLTREEARKRIVDDLKKLGLMEKIEPYAHNVGECYRCKCVVEPIVSKQWFVKMEPLAKPAIDVVKSGELRFLPKRFEKIYFNWMNNVRDWCISRQLWWGHRIPAFYCDDCGEMTVTKEDITVCPKCGGKVHQDEDVLDTWFSSALWPFSTLGYPENTADLQYFYPTDVLITAYDIIFFWVARMIFSGLEHMKKIPFKKVLIHGIIRDSNGKKMSKSLGNGVDPLDIINQYGADTLRFYLSMGVAPGSDMRYIPEKAEANRNFMNKLWNASRYVIMNLEGKELPKMFSFKFAPADKWILTKLRDLTREVIKNLDRYEIGLASTKLYDFVWGEFCDWYIELSKPFLYSDDEKKKLQTLAVLKYVLENTLKLMHPFTPFITEEIWQSLNGGALIAESYPDKNAKAYPKEAKEFELIMELIRAVRNIRAEVGAQPSKRLKLYLKAESDYHKLLDDCKEYIMRLAGIDEVLIVTDRVPHSVTSAISIGEIMISLGDLIDLDKETARIKGEIEKLQGEIKRSEGMLSNPGFTSKAPQKLIDQEKEKLELNNKKLKTFEEKLEELKI